MMIPIAFGFGGPWDMAILGGVLIVLFGGSKLGGLGKSLGEGIKEFKKATHDEPTAAAPPPTTTVNTAAPAPAPLPAPAQVNVAPAAIPAPAGQAAPPAPVSVATPEER